MPRSLNATLLAELDAGNYAKPIIRGWLGTEHSLSQEVQIISYKLTRNTLTAVFYSEAAFGFGYEEFALERGLDIGGTEYTVFTMHFTIKEMTIKRKFSTVQCDIGSDKYYTAAGDVTYETAINAWMSAISAAGFTPAYLNSSANWLDYQFLPDGKQIILNKNTRFQNMLAQKYLAYLTHNSGNTPLIFSVDDTFNRSTDWTIPVTDLDTFDEYTEFRAFRWVDENGTYHLSDGASDFPIHHLGYLESTAAPPESSPLGTTFGSTKGKGIIVTLPFHLKYLTGDKVTFTKGADTATTVLEVIEIFEPNTNIPWRIELRTLQFLSNTEGGAMPSTIERVSNYTPLNMSGFDGLLDETVNNQQAFADAVDDLFDPFPNNASQYLGGDGQWHDFPADVNLFLSSTNSDISGYETLAHTRPTGTEQTAAASITAANTEIEQFVHAAGEFDFLSAQTTHIHIHLAKTAGTKGAVAYVKLFHRTSGGTETLLGTSELSDALTGSNADYDFSISINDTEFSSTDRFVLKIFANPTGAGTDPTVTTYFEGNTDARVEVGTHLTTSGLSFNDSEGDPAAVGTAADGTSSYAARRDHVHAAGGIGFSAYRSTNQSINNAAFTKVQFDTEEWDIGAYYDNATNYRFQPAVAGKYLITACLSFPTAAGIAIALAYKNGTRFKDGNTLANTALGTSSTVSADIDMNGSSDYVEIFTYQNSGAPLNLTGGQSSSWFQASLQR